MNKAVTLGVCNNEVTKPRGFTVMKLLEVSIFSRRLKSSNSTNWLQLEDLQRQHKAINMAQGCPDYNPNTDVIENLIKISKDVSSAINHQYARRWGQPRLVEALSRISSLTMGRTPNPYTEIIISIGATHALFCTFRSLVKPGDKVTLLTPTYDCYVPQINQCGGQAEFVFLTRSNSPNGYELTSSSSIMSSSSSSSSSPSLMSSSSLPSSSEFTFNREELTSKINGSKYFVLNNPSNPLGKVYTKDELEFIAELCIKHDVVVISDEVYERFVHPPNKHIPIASLPGMWDRTLTIGSAGKSFLVAGWKCGWCIGPQHLIKMVCQINGDSVNSCPSPIQEAIAMALEKEYETWEDESSYFNQLSNMCRPKLANVAEMVQYVGMKPIYPEAGFFLYVDISDMDFDVNPDDCDTKDVQFAIWMAINKGIGVVPGNLFYPEHEKQLYPDFLRFCCIKSDATLENLKLIFQKWRNELKQVNYEECA